MTKVDTSTPALKKSIKFCVFVRERVAFADASQVASDAAVAFRRRGRREQEAARGEQQEVARVVGAVVGVV